MEDILSKRQRIERTLNLQPVDRVAIHDQVSYNPDGISEYLKIRTEKDIMKVHAIADKTLSPVDALFPDTPWESVETMIKAWQEAQ